MEWAVLYLMELHVCARCNSRTRCVVFCQEQSLSLSGTQEEVTTDDAYGDMDIDVYNEFRLVHLPLSYRQTDRIVVSQSDDRRLACYESTH